MMIRFSLATLLVAAVAFGTTGCASFGTNVVLDGAVAQVTDDRVYVVSRGPINGQIGQVVTVYQRVEVPAIDPDSPPWHPLRPVARGSIDEVTPQGVWVRLRSGSVATSGETELRDESN